MHLSKQAMRNVTAGRMLHIDAASFAVVYFNPRKYRFWSWAFSSCGTNYWLLRSPYAYLGRERERERAKGEKITMAAMAWR